MKDLYYMAGLIDGEGTITLWNRTNSKFRTPVVSCSSTTYAIIEFLLKTYGGTVCKQKVRQPHHKQSWSWRVVQNRAINVCSDLHNILLEPDKAHRAKMIALEYPKVTLRNGKYSKEQFAKKLLFQEEFFHPSIPVN